ncbi:hypothetical protein EST38_g4406 [Candolleomyces aberdarensis]|uniref:Uncharacterized protein n=1 Tax=Candolleomyces aberdarensis TaxID=2316362 RepID=A0A4Q2DN23_9AGAR|nr:hypothetical protein EST38_g4406 [Candolleomyces aberdarensis]
MDRVSLLGPLALLGCSAIVVGLVCLAARRFGFAGRLQSLLRYVPGIPSSSLPAPANASITSLSSSLNRTVKTAKSTVKNATHLSVPKALGSRWSQIMAFFTRRRRKRIMLEELPTTASSEDDTVSSVSKAESPVLVDLTETSSVSSPTIPLRRLGATSPPLRSPTPLLVSVSGLLATPPLTAASSSGLSRDSPPPPSTPPPYRGVRHSFIPVSPFSSPPFKATPGRGVDLQDLYPVMRQSTGLIYPHSRPSTPSPVSNNPYFLSTSPIPVSPFRYHRRTRSLGGINAKRIVAPSIPADVFNESSGHLELNNFASHRRLTSRSTELLIDLESGGEGEAVLEECSLSLVAADGGSDDFDHGLSDDGLDEDLEVLTPSHLLSRSFPSIQDRRISGSGSSGGHVAEVAEVMEREGPPARVEFPKIASNNAWREWDDDEKSLLSLHLDEPSSLEPILPIPTTTLDLSVSSRDPFVDVFTPDLGLDLFENPFDDPDAGDPFSPTPASAGEVVADSMIPDLELDSELIDDALDWDGCEVEAEGEEEEEEEEAEEEEEEEEGMGMEIGQEDEADEEKETESEEEIVLQIPCDTVSGSEEQTLSDISADLCSSHMPTPPASPPFPTLRVPSEVSLPVTAPITARDTEEAISNAPAERTELPSDPILLESTTVVALETLDDKVLEEAAEESLPTDDPPLPEIISQHTGASELSPPPTPVLPISSLADTSDEREPTGDAGELDAVVEGEPIDSVDEEASLSHSPESERSRPAWSIRAAEAPRLGMSPEVPKETPTDGVQVPSDSDRQEHDEADATQPFDQIPGAFPESDQTEQLRQRKPAAVIKDECPQARPSKLGRSSAIDTSSFAAAVVSLRRKPEPLDVALAMQMRPGLGAGADPAWMVRFMMSVFGWLAVAMSAGID